MGYLFPVNPVTRSKSESEEVAAVEKAGEQDKNSKQQNEHGQDEGFDMLEKRVKKLINEKKVLDAIELSEFDSNAKTKLLEIVKSTAASFLKKELLNVAKSILSISVDEKISDDIDDKDLSFSDYLARLVIKLASKEKPAARESVAKKVGKANPLEDRNAGFLVHYCKNILNQKIRQQKNVFKSEKLRKKDLDKYLKNNLN